MTDPQPVKQVRVELDQPGEQVAMDSASECEYSLSKKVA
jgi:hypothetical protein